MFAGLFCLTLVVSAGSGLLFGRSAISDSTMAVQNIQVPDKAIEASGKTAGEAIITIVDKNTQTPIAGAWVGVRIENAEMRTPSLTYFDWYSPVPERAFFPTDDNGQIKIPLASEVSGVIEYKVYTADIEAPDHSKYQPLNSSFVITYK